MERYRYSNVLSISRVLFSYLDTARDVYKNATLEKIELIRALLEREKASADHLQTWNVRLSVRFATDPTFLSTGL